MTFHEHFLHMWWAYLVIFIMICLSAYFSASEIAFNSANKMRLKKVDITLSLLFCNDLPPPQTNSHLSNCRGRRPRRPARTFFVVAQRAVGDASPYNVLD